MEFDVDGSGLISFQIKAQDINESGGFEQPIMFGRIYHINIEIHSYGHDTQINDGDEGIQYN
eukprot:7200506-Heterocapsa_arctica.AAC.1